MNRALRGLTLAVAVLLFSLTAPSQARADPITAFIVTAAGSIGVSAAVATFVVNAALTAAFNWAAGKLLGRNKAGVQERQASVLTLSLGEQPREALIGEICTGGGLLDAFNYGGRYSTDWVARCVAVADHALDGLVGYYVDDRYYAFSANGLQAGFSNCLDIEFVNATAGGAPPPARFLTASGGAWTAADTLASVAHVWIAYKYDDEVWTQGHPTFRFVFRGLRVYDPRLDPALGYTGPNPQTWENRASHTFSRNAALLRYAIQRGIYAEGHHGEAEHLLIGRGLSAEEAPPERIIAAANLCDEMVGGKIRYAASGVIRASDDFITVEEMFAAAMAGSIVQHEGGVEVEPGQAKAVVATITDADLVVGEPRTFSDFLPDNDGGRINSVVPRYVEPTQNWKDHAGPVRRDLDDITEDGGPREATLPLMLVTHGGQADRCAEITRRLARLEKRATNVLPPEFSGLEEGDWIAWQSARYHNGGTVKYRIESWALDEKWRMRLALREIATTVFEDATAPDDESDPPVVPDPLAPVDLEGVTVALIDEGGLPALLFGWDAPVDAAIYAIRAEVRVQGETVVSPTRSGEVNAGSMVVTNGVRTGRTLEARLVPIANTTRDVDPSAWVTVTVGTLVADDVSPTSPTIYTNLDLMLDVLLSRTEGVIAEEEQRLVAETDARDRFDVLGWVDPVTRQAELNGGDIRFTPGGLFLDDAEARVGSGLATNGDVARPLTVPIADSSNILRRTGGALYTGDLAATLGAAWGTNLTGRPAELTDGRIVAALDSSGDLARPITSGNATASNLMRRTGGGLFTGDLAATLGASWGGTLTGRPTELTDGRITAGLASNGDIARNLPSGVLTGSNLVTRTGGGGAFTGDLNATAGAAWATNLTGRPTELTDGRITAGLASNGDIARNLPSPILTGSNLVTRAGGGGLFTGDLNATLGAAWGSTLTGRPTELTDGRITAGLASNGDIARNLPSGILTGSNLVTRSGGGGVFTGDLNATAGATWGVNVGSIPTALSDGRVGLGLASNGDVARPLPSSVLTGSNLVTRAGGGGVFTGDLNATNDAAVTALAGTLGALATKNTTATADIDLNAVTVRGFHQPLGNLDIKSTSEILIAQFSVTVGANEQVDVAAELPLELVGATGGTRGDLLGGVTLRLTRGLNSDPSAVLVNAARVASIHRNYTHYPVAVIKGFDFPPAGTHIYALYGLCSSITNVTSATTNNPLLTVDRSKR